MSPPPPSSPVKVLLTGFEPFGGHRANASWEAVKLLAASALAGADLATAELSCVFGTAMVQLREAVNATEPALVLCAGQADGRADITVERVAVNLDDARIPDNAGRQPLDEPIVEGGPAAYFSSFPVKACVAAVRAAGLPASVSQTAGTFVCNHVFYALAHLIATERPALRGGFVHVPPTPRQVADQAAPATPSTPSMSARDTAAGLAAVLGAALGTTAGADIRLPGGAVC